MGGKEGGERGVVRRRGGRVVRPRPTVEPPNNRRIWDLQYREVVLSSGVKMH